MLILNPKDLNQYIEYNHFKMQGLQEILHLVTLLQKIAAYYISRMHIVQFLLTKVFKSI